MNKDKCSSGWFFFISLLNISQFPLITLWEDFLNNWLLLCTLCRWGISNSKSQVYKNFPIHNICHYCLKMSVGMWPDLTQCAIKSWRSRICYSLGYNDNIWRLQMLKILWDFVYVFPFTWLQFLNPFFFPLLNLLRKCVKSSCHYILSFYFLYLFFILLSGLFSLKDFLTLLELYFHGFSVLFRINWDLLWCYINSKDKCFIPEFAFICLIIISGSCLLNFGGLKTQSYL